MGLPYVTWNRQMVWVHAQSCQASSRKRSSQGHLDLLPFPFAPTVLFLTHLNRGTWKGLEIFCTSDKPWNSGSWDKEMRKDVKNANSIYNSNLHSCRERLSMLSCFSTRQTHLLEGLLLAGSAEAPWRTLGGIHRFQIAKVGFNQSSCSAFPLPSLGTCNPWDTPLLWSQ